MELSRREIIKSGITALVPIITGKMFVPIVTPYRHGEPAIVEAPAHVLALPKFVEEAYSGGVEGVWVTIETKDRRLRFEGLASGVEIRATSAPIECEGPTGEVFKYSGLNGIEADIHFVSSGPVTLETPVD